MGVCESKVNKNKLKEASKKDLEKELVSEKEKIDIQIKDIDKKITILEEKNSVKLKLALEEKKKNNKAKVIRLLKEIKLNKININKLTGTNGMLKDRQDKLDDLIMNNEMTKITKKNNELISKNMENQDDKVNIIKNANDVNMHMQENQNNLNDMVKATNENLISDQDLDDEFNKLGESELLDELEKYKIDIVKDENFEKDIVSEISEKKILKPMIV